MSHRRGSVGEEWSQTSLRRGLGFGAGIDKLPAGAPTDVGSTFTIRVTGSGPGLESQSVDSAASAPAKWNSKVTARSRPGKKKATITIRPVSYGPAKPTGSVTIKLRNKTIKTVRLKNGQAVVTIRMKRKQKLDIFYNGSSTTHASRAPLFVRIKK